MRSRTRCAYGVPDTRDTISPSSWKPMFEYFCWVLGGTDVDMSAARARFAVGSPS
jgi:hypothetical protein